MKIIELDGYSEAAITQMRAGSVEAINDELQDGNMIPRLCSYAGAGACKDACQLKLNSNETLVGKQCAENNIVASLAELNVEPDNFAIVGATKDNIGFGDQIRELGGGQHADGYSLIAGYNAFFWRPNQDTNLGGRPLTHVAMRMADCGDVVIRGDDAQGNQILGISHFSRTNMRGPSEYAHELDGKPVSWGENVIGSAVKHYGIDPKSLKVTLVAAIEGKDFIHTFADTTKMHTYFPGWDELGFMHPEGAEDFDCLIDYREMIEWQLTEGITNPDYQLASKNITVSQVINTGDLRLGHASHQGASKGQIAHGRDMYVFGARNA